MIMYHRRIALLECDLSQHSHLYKVASCRRQRQVPTRINTSRYSSTVAGYNVACMTEAVYLARGEHNWRPSLSS